mgnify:FL=1|tara:strand:- start:1374 stop:1652 length:279 start_codon:yes stop_codon:yes gene_type:complete
MAIKLNDKWYDETKFKPELKNSIIQVNKYQNQISNLNADIQNCKIIVAHHAKFINENVPAAAEIEAPKPEAKEPETRLEQMANISSDAVAPE